MLKQRVSSDLWISGKQQVGNECDPYLDYDGICAFPIEVPEREILLCLLEYGMETAVLQGFNLRFPGKKMTFLRFLLVSKRLCACKQKTLRLQAKSFTLTSKNPNQVFNERELL